HPARRISGAHLQLFASALVIAFGAGGGHAHALRGVAKLRSAHARADELPTALPGVADLEGGTVALVIPRLTHRGEALAGGRVAKRGANAGRARGPPGAIVVARLERRFAAAELTGRAHRTVGGSIGLHRSVAAPAARAAFGGRAVHHSLCDLRTVVVDDHRG